VPIANVVVLLHVHDQAVDAAGGLSGAIGQFGHFIGDDGKPATMFSGPCGFDRGVEGQQSGLVRDELNLADHAGDRLGAALDLVHNGRDLQRHFRRLHDVADKPFEHGIRRLQHRIETRLAVAEQVRGLLGLSVAREAIMPNRCPRSVAACSVC
jgi:hypothetical protein